MNVERVELRTIRMTLVAPFETSFGVQQERIILLVAVHADGLTGWGECVAGEDPFYSAETPTTCLYILEQYLVPALFEGRISGDPNEFHLESSFVRGHHMARAALEAALWDLEAQRRQKPLHELFGGVRDLLYTGVSVGIQPTLEQLVDVVGGYVDNGYRRIKIKIKPGWDVEPVAAIRKKFPDIPLMVDANCAFSREQEQVLIDLDQYNLMMIEQPYSADDLILHAALQRKINTPVCLDESAHSIGVIEAAIALKACKIVNVKQGRIGGPSQAILTNRICREAGIDVWCGGMLETGIGRALNIAIATMDNFNFPGDVSASNRYWHKDIIEPEVTVSPDGTIEVPKGVGLGFKPNLGYIDQLTTELIQLFP